LLGKRAIAFLISSIFLKTASWITGKSKLIFFLDISTAFEILVNNKVNNIILIMIYPFILCSYIPSKSSGGSIK